LHFEEFPEDCIICCCREWRWFWLKIFSLSSECWWEGNPKSSKSDLNDEYKFWFKDPGGKPIIRRRRRFEERNSCDKRESSERQRLLFKYYYK
jgi:hypothetical protein